MDIQLPQIIYQLVNFGVVFGAVTYLLYKPVQKILDERSKRIADSLENIEDNAPRGMPWNRAVKETVWLNEDDNEVYLRGKLLKDILKEMKE